MGFPVYGPHDDNMTLPEWFHLTLKRMAHGNDEEEEFTNFIGILRKEFKVFDVASLMQVTRLQLEQAATKAVGEQGKRGLVRMVCKYLGPEGSPHIPPSELSSDALGCPNDVHNQQLQFGRLGKGACNSTESNFPEAMIPSRRAKALSADELKFPAGLHNWLQKKCSQYNKDHRMTRDVTIEITRMVGDWVISMYGCSPVSMQ